MRILSANIGNTHIIFDNCMWTGNELIYVNGRLVSKQFSWLGTDHWFEVEEEGKWIEYHLITRLDWKGINCDLLRNGVYVVKAGGYGTCVTTPTNEAPFYLESDLV